MVLAELFSRDCDMVRLRRCAIGLEIRACCWAKPDLLETVLETRGNSLHAVGLDRPIHHIWLLEYSLSPFFSVSRLNPGFLTIFMALMLLPALTMPAGASTVDARKAFTEAMTELRTGVGPRYLQLREQLEDYPLAEYLDYQVLLEQLHDMRPATARDFLDRVRDSPLYGRFLAAYLEHKGRDRRWRDFLAVADRQPRDVALQCYYFRAKRDTGAKAEAWEGARQLWNVGKSQHKACDPLFERWIKNGGGPDDALVWSRALNAFDSRSPHIIRYIRRYASSELKPLLDELAEVYRHPDRLVADAHQASTRHAELMTAGIRRLARVNPEQGRLALLNAIPVQSFTPQQVRDMELMIARHSLFAQSAAPESWLIDTLGELRDDELTEIYLRKQVEEGHWSALLEGLPWLSDRGRAKDQWRYWHARALAETGNATEATAKLQSLAMERSYHGFLAADKVGAPYNLNARQPEDISPPADRGIERTAELLALNQFSDARLEWRMVVQRAGLADQIALAHLALERDWPYFAIDAANEAKAWDYVGLRFPLAFVSVFSEAAQRVGLDPHEIMAIARRESAMFPLAQSGVGARGLMQVMPATGRLVARQTGIPWRSAGLYEVEYNVSIGSQYYRGLLDRFDGHRPKALAGYNAGPNRVDRWAETDIPVDQWIDSLPFRETREYVQAVLAYTVIYQQRAGEASSVLKASEWKLTNQKDNL